MAPELRELMRAAAGPPAVADVEAIRAGARRRRTRRRTAGAVAVAVIAVPLALAVLGPLTSTTVGLTDRPPPEAPAVVPALERVDAADAGAPTLLPAGFTRCKGPAIAGALTVTEFCDGDVVLRLRHGPHSALEERGEEIPVGTRTGTTLVADDGWREVTVSDSDSPGDTHYRLEAPAAYSPEVLAEILESIPDFERAAG
ncbi:MAG: hypothetical protein H0V05_21580 [Euzebyaceae bacterium]|nr:hypothetical protein [Euzebyaceae bacterium]